MNITGLISNSTYHVIVSSNYNNISINSISQTFYTVNPPDISLSTSTKYYNKNYIYTIYCNYSVNKTPIYYLLNIIYPDTTEYPYTTDISYFHFINLKQVGNYTISLTAVYDNNITSNSSKSIYVNNYVPVLLNSVKSSSDNSCNILINYQINDNKSYSLYITNSNNYNYIIKDLSRNINVYTFNGLILNSGTYNIYIYNENQNNSYQTNTISYTLPYTVPSMKIQNIVNNSSNSLIVSYSIQNSYNTNYNIILQSVSFPEISYNVFIVSSNTTTRFVNLYYNSGRYKVYLLSNYNVGIIGNGDISYASLPIISPILFNRS